jgi:copper chaperone
MGWVACWVVGWIVGWGVWGMLYEYGVVLFVATGVHFIFLGFAVKFLVPDMTCNHCVQSITKAVHSVSAEAHVVFDLPHHLVEVQDLAHVLPEKLIAAMDEIGFEATLLEADS